MMARLLNSSIVLNEEANLMGKESSRRNFKKRRLFKGVLLDTENLVSVLF